MRAFPPQTKELNTANHLTAHRVSTKTPPDLIESSLKHTRTLFPHEPTAAEGLSRAYQSLICGHGRLEDCELLEYFIYTAGPISAPSVVGAAGLYHIIESSSEMATLLDLLRLNPPPGVSFLRNHQQSIHEFIWGGRLSIESSGAHSRHIMPHIINHILSAAIEIVRDKQWVPVLLAFTLRDNNRRVQAFYRNLGFERTAATLEFANETQDVWALSLKRDSPALERIRSIIKR
jgi:hypothetical protein